MTHISRSFDGGGHIEASCPCPLEPCGMVDTDKVVPECTQHPPTACKTMRDSHPADMCPGVGRAVVIALGRTDKARQAILDAAAMESEGFVNASIFDAIDDYRAAVEHEAAERIRGFSETPEGRVADWWDAAVIPDAIADFLDPEVTS